MSRFSDTVRDERGHPIPNATVYVYEWDYPSDTTGALSALTDDDLTTVLANPLTTDEFGEFYFNTDDGLKMLEFHYGGKLLYREQAILTPAGVYPGNDAALRADLVAPGGGALMEFSHSSTYAKGTAGGKLKTKINPYDYPFNCIGDNSADDTVKFQQAVDFVTSSPISRSLELPGELTFKITAPITSTRPMRMVGEGVSPYRGDIGTNFWTPDSGSIIHPAHTGKALVFSDSVPISGVQLENFGILRDQPAPGPGWAPNDHDYDIYLRSAAAEIIRVVHINATRGIKADEGNYGKFSVVGGRGQFFKVGIYADKQYDRGLIHDLQEWSYGADQADVIAYQHANLIALYMLRVDAMQLSNIFTIHAMAGLRIGQSATSGSYPGGTANKLQVSNVNFDIGKYGLWIDNTVTAGAIVDVVNFCAQCDNISGSIPILVEGNSNLLSILNADLRLAGQNAVKVAGTSNLIHLGGEVLVNGYNAAAGGYEAFRAETGNSLFVNATPSTTGGGSGAAYGGSGIIETPDWRSWSPTITPAAGSFTTVTVDASTKYRRFGNRVDIDLLFTLTTVGTGSGAINLPLPVTSAGNVVLNGYIASGAGNGAVFGVNGAGATSAQILKFDNSSAIGAANAIRVTGSYRV